MLKFYIFLVQETPVTKTKHSCTVISVQPAGSINLNAIAAGENYCVTSWLALVLVKIVGSNYDSQFLPYTENKVAFL